MFIANFAKFEEHVAPYVRAAAPRRNDISVAVAE
jgi:hypothetical protein